jgi:hypothetical protein
VQLFTPRLLLCVFCPDILCLPTACRLWDLLLLTPPPDRRAFLITLAYSIFRVPATHPTFETKRPLLSFRESLLVLLTSFTHN